MMKRRVAILGLALITGLPRVAAGAGWVNGSASDGSLPVDGFESRQYGAQGSVYRLVAGPSIPQALRQQNIVDTWQMEFVAPRSAYRSDDPLTANDKRVGVTFKLDF
jgi:hypothetical protein